jgi:hypothetical protein
MVSLREVLKIAFLMSVLSVFVAGPSAQAQMCGLPDFGQATRNSQSLVVTVDYTCEDAYEDCATETADCPTDPWDEKMVFML